MIRLLALMYLLPLPLAPAGPPTVPQCRDVKLHASYLVEEAPGQGPGFLLTLENGRTAAVSVPDPVPLGIDWYAAEGGAWSWRASSGSGGSLVNALDSKGRLFATLARPGSSPQRIRTIPAGGQLSWTVRMRAEPSLAYRPGCEHCAYSGETRFRAVLAYAYLPAGPVAVQEPLLGCGLRTAPVDMPPLEDSAKHHNLPPR